MKLSPSKLNLFRECPKCFWLQENKSIKRPAGIFPSLPSGMDRVLKQYFDTFRVINSVPREVDHLKCKLFQNKDLLDIWTSNFKGIQWEDESGNILMGAVDEVLTKGNKLIVLDFKTRGYPLKEDTADHYQNQLNIYNFLLRKKGYDTEDYAYLLFYHPKEVDDDGKFLFNTDLIKMPVYVDEAEKLFSDAIKLLQGPMPECNCEFCKNYEIS